VSGKCINEVLETVDASPARYASNLYGAQLGYCLETVDALPARYASTLYGAQLGTRTNNYKLKACKSKIHDSREVFYNSDEEEVIAAT
jgi:hypothetical protein